MQPCGLPSFHKVRRRIIDVVMLALAGTAFRSEYATTVDILEIPIGKLIVLIPYAVFGQAVEADVFAFLHGGRLVLAPCISLVEYKSCFVDKFFSTLSCALVKRHGHEWSPFPVVTHPSLILRTGLFGCRGRRFVTDTSEQATP
jgi:hypothetical protein